MIRHVSLAQEATELQVSQAPQVLREVPKVPKSELHVPKFYLFIVITANQRYSGSITQHHPDTGVTDKLNRLLSSLLKLKYDIIKTIKYSYETRNLKRTLFQNKSATNTSVPLFLD